MPRTLLVVGGRERGDDYTTMVVYKKVGFFWFQVTN